MFQFRRLASSVVLLLAAAVPAHSEAQPPQPRENPELLRILRDQGPEAALKAAQDLLAAGPSDENARRDFVDLHYALARRWFSQKRLDPAASALEAVLSIDPKHAGALDLQREIASARARALAEIPQVDQFLKLELFESALDEAREIRRLRPDLEDRLKRVEIAAWLGAADDHYLARNFNESLALYETVLSLDENSPAQVRSRWAISLALALADETAAERDPHSVQRLLKRAIEVLQLTNEPVLSQIIAGLLAESAGQQLEAGRAYAMALGENFEVIAAPERKARLTDLRKRCITAAREVYSATGTQRRTGFWSVALPNDWKNRRSTHFDVYARNDVIAERVLAALEFHYAGLATWLGFNAPEKLDPICEIRVYASLDELRAATGARGITYAVTHTQLRGEDLVSRKVEVFQQDPWLLSSTLPHELTHILIAEHWKRAAAPLVIDEGLALHVEPAARELMYRRLLHDQKPPVPADLLAAAQIPADIEGFYAQADALTGFLLDRAAELPDTAPASQPAHQNNSNGTTSGPPIARLLSLLRTSDPWWKSLQFRDEPSAAKEWTTWFKARAAPARMPLMTLGEKTDSAPDSLPPAPSAPAKENSGNPRGAPK